MAGSDSYINVINYTVILFILLSVAVFFLLLKCVRLCMHGTSPRKKILVCIFFMSRGK